MSVEAIRAPSGKGTLGLALSLHSDFKKTSARVRYRLEGCVEARDRSFGSTFAPSRLHSSGETVLAFVRERR